METVFKTLLCLETELCSEGIRKDAGRLARLLHPDFVEFGKSGNVYTKADLLSEMPEWVYRETHLTDFKFRQLAENSALLTYRSLAAGIRSNRSSIWIKTKEQWQLLHHQGTALPADTGQPVVGTADKS